MLWAHRTKKWVSNNSNSNKKKWARNDEDWRIITLNRICAIFVFPFLLFVEMEKQVMFKILLLCVCSSSSELYQYFFFYFVLFMVMTRGGKKNAPRKLMKMVGLNNKEQFSFDLVGVLYSQLRPARSSHIVRRAR